MDDEKGHATPKTEVAVDQAVASPPQPYDDTPSESKGDPVKDADNSNTAMMFCERCHALQEPCGFLDCDNKANLAYMRRKQSEAEADIQEAYEKTDMTESLEDFESTFMKKRVQDAIASAPPPVFNSTPHYKNRTCHNGWGPRPRDYVSKSCESIHDLACYGSKAEVEEFLTTKADLGGSECHGYGTGIVNRRTGNGDTALHIAVNHSRPEMVETLLLWQADMSIINNDGDTAIARAYALGDSAETGKIINILEQWQSKGEKLDSTAPLTITHLSMSDEDMDKASTKALTVALRDATDKAQNPSLRLRRKHDACLSFPMSVLKKNVTNTEVAAQDGGSGGGSGGGKPPIHAVNRIYTNTDATHSFPEPMSVVSETEAPQFCGKESTHTRVSPDGTILAIDGNTFDVEKAFIRGNLATKRHSTKLLGCWACNSRDHLYKDCPLPKKVKLGRGFGLQNKKRVQPRKRSRSGRTRGSRQFPNCQTRSKQAILLTAVDEYIKARNRDEEDKLCNPQKRFKTDTTPLTSAQTKALQSLITPEKCWIRMLGTNKSGHNRDHGQRRMYTSLTTKEHRRQAAQNFARRVFQLVREAPRDINEQNEFLSRLPRELQRRVTCELLEQSLTKTKELRRRKKNCNTKDALILHSAVKEEKKRAKCLGKRGTKLVVMRPQDQQKMSVADRMAMLEARAQKAILDRDKDGLRDTILMMRDLPTFKREVCPDMGTPPRQGNGNAATPTPPSPDDFPQARFGISSDRISDGDESHESIFRLQIAETSGLKCALNDTGSSICVTGDPSCFSSQCALDLSLPTASSAVQGSNLTHRHSEWLNTKFCDPLKGDEVVFELPIRWRFEPAMGNTQTILSPSIFTRPWPNSRTICAGTTQAADDARDGSRSGIYINDHDGKRLQHLPVLAWQRSDYFCLRFTPIPKERWPKDPERSGIEFPAHWGEGIKENVRTLGEQHGIPSGIIGQLAHPDGGLHDMSEGKQDMIPPTGPFGVATPTSHGSTVKAQQRFGPIKRGSLKYWHSVFLHKNKARLVGTLKNGTGAAFSNTTNTFFCSSCVQGKGVLPNKKATGNHLHAALENFLSPGVAAGLTAEDVDEVKLAALNHLKELSKKATGYRDADAVAPRIAAREGLTRPMQNLNADVLGPYLDQRGKKVYLMFFVDRLTHFRWAFQIASKDAALSTIGKMVLIANTLQLKIQQITTDHGGEFSGERWKTECALNNIKATALNANSQHGNYAERWVKEFKEDLRCTLIHAMLPLRPYALLIVNAVLYISNRLTSASLGDLSPFFLLYGIPPDFSQLQVIGSSGWILKPNSTRSGGFNYESGLGRQAIQGILVGYTDAGHYIMRRMDNGQLLNTRSVSFEDLTEPRTRAPMAHREDDRALPIAEADDVYASFESMVRRGGYFYEDEDSQVASLGAGGAWRLFMNARKIAPEDFTSDEVDIDEYDGEYSSDEDGGLYEDEDGVPGGREQPRDPILPQPQPEHPQPREQRVPRPHRAERAEILPPPAEGKGDDIDEPQPPQNMGAGTRRSTRSNAGQRNIINVDENYANKPNEPVMGAQPRVNALSENPVPDWFLVQEGEIIERDHFTFEETEDCSVLLDFDADDRIKTVVVRITGGDGQIPDALKTPRDSGLHENNPDYSLQERLASIATKNATQKDFVRRIKDSGMNYGEAIAKNWDPHDRKMFQKATDKEWLLNLIGTKAVGYVDWEDVPEGTKPIPLLATYSRKKCPITGKTIVWKCRICLRGDLMGPEHVHEGPLYAPTVDLTTVRCCLGIGTRPGIKRAKFDISSAFTKATPGALVFARTTAGCHEYDIHGRQKLVKILANLYGSPDAARRWIELASNLFQRIGFRRSLMDAGLFRISLPVDVAKEEMATWEANKDMDKDYEKPKKRYPYPRKEAKSFASTITGPPGSEELREELGNFQEIHDFPCESDKTKEFDFNDPDDLILNQPRNYEPGHVWAILNLWVDDGLLTSNSSPFMEYIIKRTLHRFPGTSELNPESFLGLVLDTGSGNLKITQDQLIGTTLSDCKMGGSNKSNCTPMNTFIVPNTETHSPEYKAAIDKEINMYRLCGQLGWLRHSLPGLAFLHGQLARVMSNVNSDHIKIAKYAMRWLQGQRGTGLTYNPEEDKGIRIFSDTGLSPKKTFSGMVALFAGGTVAASSGGQKFEVMSSMESEIAGLTEAAKFAIRLQATLIDMGEEVGTVTIYGDNQAAVNELQHGAPECASKRLRHMRLRINWAKSLVAKKRVRYEWISTKHMLADLATKPVPKDIWNELYPQVMGLAPIKALEGIPTMTELYGPMPTPDLEEDTGVWQPHGETVSKSRTNDKLNYLSSSHQGVSTRAPDVDDGAEEKSSERTMKGGFGHYVTTVRCENHHGVRNSRLVLDSLQPSKGFAESTQPWHPQSPGGDSGGVGPAYATGIALGTTPGGGTGGHNTSDLVTGKSTTGGSKQ